MPRIFVKTWGCTLNRSDSDIMRAILADEGFGFAESELDADVIILNTCTVKGATESRILAEIRRLAKAGMKIVVAGCLSENADRILAVAPDAPIVGAGATHSIGEAAKLALSGTGKGAVFRKYGRKYALPRIITAPIARIPIEEGCMSNCAFCQTKLARPLLMSYPQKEVVRLVEEAVKLGANEIHLTGMDTGAYGFDIGTDLAGLLEAVLAVEGKFKIRLGMINPDHVKRMREGLVRAFKNEKMFRFLHMPVQSGSEKVCREMKRAHTVADFEDMAAHFRKQIPGISIATDIIIAYPTETEDDCGETIRMLERVKPEMVNFSRFAPRPGTDAKRLKQLDGRIAKKRVGYAAAEIRRISAQSAGKFVGTEMDALINEQGSRGQMKGKASNYMQLVVRGGKGFLGKEVRVKITGARGFTLFGKIICR